MSKYIYKLEIELEEKPNENELLEIANFINDICDCREVGIELMYE